MKTTTRILVSLLSAAIGTIVMFFVMDLISEMEFNPILYVIMFAWFAIMGYFIPVITNKLHRKNS